MMKKRRVDNFDGRTASVESQRAIPTTTQECHRRSSRFDRALDDERAGHSSDYVRANLKNARASAGSQDSFAIREERNDVIESATVNHGMNHQHCRETGDIVCFGMFEVTQIDVCSGRQSLCSEGFTEAILDKSDIWLKSDTGSEEIRMFGRIHCDRSLQILARLSAVEQIILETYCCRVRDPAFHVRKRKKLATTFKLTVNIYGKHYLFDTIGNFFCQIRINLNDPLLCARDVRYTNPHMLVDEQTSHIPVMTSLFKDRSHKEAFVAPSNVFDEIVQKDELAEGDQPPFIRTKLHKHQKQALYFMQRRESGYSMELLTGQCSFELSTSQGEGVIRGGLIADQMGLGKTLQMISLIATDMIRFQLSMPTNINATLVVVPLSLLQTWKDQLLIHLDEKSLNVQLYYGNKRKLDLGKLVLPGVVLTTYETVLSDFRKREVYNTDCSVYQTNWHRVILDEAHIIRNPVSQKAQAMYALEARNRWAVTGTPIQNRLLDLFSLLRFFRASPFDDIHRFRASITDPWGLHLDTSTVPLLRNIVHSVALRRTKTSVSLPKRTDEIRRVTFDSHERYHYEYMKTGLQQHFMDLEDENVGVHDTFRWINNLRSICSRGVETTDESESDGFQQEELLTEIDNSEQVEEINEIGPPVNFRFEKCIRVGLQAATEFSHSSYSPDGETNASIPSEHPKNHYLSVNWCSGAAPTSPLSPASPHSSQTSCGDEIEPPMFTKFRALLADLTSHDGKSVVFSFWRLTLSAISTILTNKEITHLVLDGSKSVTERNNLIEQFRYDGNVKILLATISAGGVGLDLTSANQVCLVEPQWNPTIEEQALSRVHRMNQTRPVTTIRYVMEGSIEESILDLQKQKTNLASLAFNENNVQTGKRLLQDLKLLIL